LIEGLKDFFGDAFTNSEELVKVSKHTYKVELKNSDNIVFEFTPYNSELILNINTEQAEMRLVFRKINKVKMFSEIEYYSELYFILN